MQNTQAVEETLDPPKDDSPEEISRYLARIADAMKGEEVMVMDMRGVVNYTDMFVLATCNSTTQIGATAERMRRGMRKVGRREVNRGETRSSSWTVLDFSDVVVHLFTLDTRNYYRMDELWGDAEPLDWE